MYYIQCQYAHVLSQLHFTKPTRHMRIDNPLLADFAFGSPDVPNLQSHPTFSIVSGVHFAAKHPFILKITL